jgi:23S rRNA pseudouridine2605 synthase
MQGDQAMQENEDGVRVQKVLAMRGEISRRKADALVQAGKVRLPGGRLIKPGDKIDPKSTLWVEGRPLERLGVEKFYFAFYKPKGVVSTFESSKDHATLAKSFPVKAPHLFCVGRLDAIAEGLLLVTNDGEFANRVSHPRYGIPKEYLVKVQGKLDTRALQATLQGVWDAGELLKPSSVSVISEARKNQWLRVVMREGKYHEIRRLFGHQGYFVLKIKRVRVGPVMLGALQPGQARPLSTKEVRGLLNPSLAESAAVPGPKERSWRRH